MSIVSFHMFYNWLKELVNRKVVADYSDQMNDLAEKLLQLISESLGLPSSCIRDTISEFYQNITVSYYPPCPQPELTLGLQSHSDMGAVTLLIQDDVGGLEVLKDGKWILVNPLCDAIFVILADQTEVLLNYVSFLFTLRFCQHALWMFCGFYERPSDTRKISGHEEELVKLKFLVYHKI